MNSKDAMYSWHLSLRVDRPVEVSQSWFKLMNNVVGDSMDGKILKYRYDEYVEWRDYLELWRSIHDSYGEEGDYILCWMIAVIPSQKLPIALKNNSSGGNLNRLKIILYWIDKCEKIYGMARSRIVKCTCSLVHAISIRWAGGDSKKLIAAVRSIVHGFIYCKRAIGELYIFASLYDLIDDCSHNSLFLVTNLSPLSCCTQINIQNNIHSI